MLSCSGQVDEVIGNGRPSGDPNPAAARALLRSRTGFGCPRFGDTILCGPSSAPAFVKDLSARFEDMARPLWSAGAPLDGQGVRIIAVRLDPGTYAFVPHASWSLAVALQSISQDAGTAQLQGYGHGLLFEGSDATRLRALRAMYVAGNYRQQGVPGLPVDGEGGAIYLLFIRDALPFEDTSGIVRPSF